MAARRTRGKGEFKHRFKVEPFPSAIENTFRDAADAFRDWEPALRGAAPVMARGIMDNIAARGETLDTGGRWPDPGEYQERKALDGFGSQPLRRTSRMTDALSRGTVLAHGKTAISVGILEADFPQVFDLNFHAYPFMGWSDQMVAEVNSLLQAYVDAALREIAARLS